MTARKDHTSLIESIFCLERAIQDHNMPYKTIQDHKKPYKAIQDKNTSLKAIIGPTRPQMPVKTWTNDFVTLNSCIATFFWKIYCSFFNISSSFWNIFVLFGTKIVRELIFFPFGAFFAHDQEQQQQQSFFY